MSTPRKRLSGVAIEQLKAADQSIAYADELSRTARAKREESDRLLRKLEDIHTMKSNPAHAQQILIVAARIRAEADTIDAEVRESLAHARRFITAAQVAHKFAEDE